MALRVACMNLVKFIKYAFYSRDNFFVLKLLYRWFCEHYGAFQLTPSPARELSLVEIAELVDEYPQAAYVVGGVNMLTLKTAICVFW